MKVNDRVSIIVPIYNIEKYVSQCVESLLQQTYNNIEIILVNDGSTDNSLSIIKEIENKHNNVRVINQKNSGVSAARNAGIKKASGGYIVFVDGDDYLSEDYINYMVNVIMKDDSDFAFSTENFKKNGEEQPKNIFYKVISNNESCATLLSPNVTVGCWNKIYRKDFLVNNNLFFDEKLFYGEGLQFIIDCSIKAKKIAICNKKLYYYRKNNISSATSSFSIEKIYNGEKSLLKIKDKIDLNDKLVNCMFKLHLSTFYLAAIARMSENRLKKKYKNDYNKWKNYIISNYRIIFFNKNVSLYRKTMLFVGMISPKFISFLDKIRRKRIYANSIK